MSIVLRWVLSAAALILVAYLVPGVEVSGVYAALVAAAILGLANVLIRPILLLLTLPITILTLGLFAFVVNALVLWFTSTIVKGFDIANFSAALWAALILWLVGWVTNALTERTD